MQYYISTANEWFFPLFFYHFQILFCKLQIMNKQYLNSEEINRAVRPLEHGARQVDVVDQLWTFESVIIRLWQCQPELVHPTKRLFGQQRNKRFTSLLKL